jgi:hypothetical protein
MDEGAGRPYSPLGYKIDELARKRNIRGPYQIARRVVGRTGGEGPTGSAWSQILYGRTHPQPLTMLQFAKAFNLSEEERLELATPYTFPPDKEAELEARIKDNKS